MRGCCSGRGRSGYCRYPIPVSHLIHYPRLPRDPLHIAAPCHGLGIGVGHIVVAGSSHLQAVVLETHSATASASHHRNVLVGRRCSSCAGPDDGFHVEAARPQLAEPESAALCYPKQIWKDAS